MWHRVGPKGRLVRWWQGRAGSKAARGTRPQGQVGHTAWDAWARGPLQHGTTGHCSTARQGTAALQGVQHRDGMAEEGVEERESVRQCRQWQCSVLCRPMHRFGSHPLPRGGDPAMEQRLPSWAVRSQLSCLPKLDAGGAQPPELQQSVPPTTACACCKEGPGPAECTHGSSHTHPRGPGATAGAGSRLSCAGRQGARRGRRRCGVQSSQPVPRGCMSVHAWACACIHVCMCVGRKEGRG